MEILGIDVGASGIKGAVVDIKKGGLVTLRHRIPTPHPATPKAVAKTIAELAAHFKWKGKIGCGFPAAIHNGVAVTAANIDKKWVDENAEKLFSKTTGCKVKVLNDADAAGLAEATFGAGKGVKGKIILLTIGTGIGSAFIIDGKLVSNTELGHLNFMGGIAEHYAADSIRKKEGLSWKEWAHRFDEFLNHVYGLFYPDLFILGGGASKKFDKFKDHFTPPVKIIPAALLNEAGIVGAALAWK